MSRIALKLAIALLPPSRRAWGEAMVAEFAHLSGEQNGFAWGCLGASVRENFFTIQGWARFGFLAIAAIAAINILTAVSHIRFWVDSEVSELVRANYIVESLSVAVFSALILFLIYKPISKVLCIEETIEFGVKLVVVQIAGLVSLGLFSTTNAIAMGMDISARSLLNSLLPQVLSGLIFILVGICGWRGAQQLRNGAFIAMIVLAIFGLAGPQIWVRPENSILAPFASLLGLESKVFPDGLLYLSDPPLSALRMGMVWAVALTLLLLKRWFGMKPVASL